jgi:hypothetical protein
MEDFAVSIIISTPIEVTNKVKILCENELELLKSCKENNLDYCFLFENLYKDCLKFKEKEKKEKN